MGTPGSTANARRILLPALAATLCALGPLGSAADSGPSYSDLSPDTALRSWLVLAPIPVGREGETAPPEPEQEAAFERDHLLVVGGERHAAPEDGTALKLAGRTLTWRRVESKADAVDLATAFGSAHSIAYAFARIEMPEARSVLFGLGSDDGVEVWLNGQLVHTRWVARAVRVDDDLLELKLRKGINRLMLKIQNRGGGWGFVMRPITATRLHERLSEMVMAGDVEGVRRAARLAAGGNAKGKYGLSAYQWARVYGRKAMLAVLEAAGASTATAVEPPENVVDAFFKDVVRPDQPGAAVLVAKDGQILFKKAYGLADVESGQPVTLDTRFGIASITKPFTAAAILKLQEEGRLGLDDTLSKFIPDYPRGGEITLRHLLTHTSGIRETLGGSSALPNFFAPLTREHVIASFEYLPLNFDPGSQYAYCNPGYYLLGTIIEKVSGLSYVDFLRDRFFTPLHMARTSAGEPGALGKATPYWYPDKRIERLQKMTDRPSPMTNGGQGVLDSTVEDLHLWTEAYFGGRILTEASLTAALTPSVHARTALSHPRTGGYGLGWSIARLRGLREVFHTGSGNGYSGVLYHFPEERFTVVILTNSGAPLPTYEPSDAAEMIAELYLHDRMELRAEPTPARVDPHAYDAYVGRYDLGFNGILSVTRLGSHLFGQSTFHPRIELFPATGTSFFYDRSVLDADVEFVKNAQGVVTHAVHCIGGDAVIAPRLLEVPRSILATYAGTFRIANDQRLSVTLEGDSFFVQVAGQPKLELLPRSTNAFFLLEAKVSLEFAPDADGNVSRVVLHQDGRTVEAVRSPAAPEMIATTAPAASSGTPPAIPPALAPEVKRPALMQAVVVPMAGSYAQHGVALEMLAAFLASRGVTPAGPPFGRYLNSPATTPEPDLRWEVGFPVANPAAVPKPFELRTLDDPLIVTAIALGPHAQPRPWPELMQWIARNGYVPLGPTMETWLDGPASELRIAIGQAAAH